MLPDKIKRCYVVERKPFERSMDNSWFYNDYRWRRFTKRFKQRHPLCEACDQDGIVSATNVVDHKEQFTTTANGWDLNKLKDSDYNALCVYHHNSRSGSQAHGDMGVNHQ